MRDMNTTRTTCESPAAGDDDLQMWIWGRFMFYGSFESNVKMDLCLSLDLRCQISAAAETELRRMNS